jgi:spore germination cell wall hydrolase CwlJ-like protein
VLRLTQLVTTIAFLAIVPTPVHAARPQTAPPNTLAQLVARGSSAGTDSAEHRCLARAVYAEAKSEPILGQLAVAQVILNRTRAGGRFPTSVCGVVTQPGQFADLRHLAIDYSAATWQQAVGIARVAMANQWRQVAANALYFHANYVAPAWPFTRVGSIGRHIFYR